MSSTTSPAETESSVFVGLTRLAQYGFFAVIVASAANALVRVIALAVFAIPAEFELFPLGWDLVIVSSAIGAVGATIVYGVITSYSTRPNRTFTILAAVVLLLSFAGPVNMFLAPPPGSHAFPVTVFATVAVMHVVGAVAIIGVLTRAPNPG